MRETDWIGRAVFSGYLAGTLGGCGAGLLTADATIRSYEISSAVARTGVYLEEVITHGAGGFVLGALAGLTLCKLVELPQKIKRRFVRENKDDVPKS